MNATRQPVAVVVGATSKWQADGRNTQLAHGQVLDDSDLPVGIRWGVGGAAARRPWRAHTCLMWHRPWAWPILPEEEQEQIVSGTTT
jgi:hypothetical protein